MDERKNRETERLVNKQIDKQTYRQMDKKKDIHTEGLSYRQIDKHTYR